MNMRTTAAHYLISVCVLVAMMLLAMTGCSRQKKVPLAFNAVPLLGKTTADVESQLGKPLKTMKLDSTYYAKLPGGGEQRNYQYKNITFDVIYDTAGTSKALWFAYGLDDCKYDDWKTWVSKFGLDGLAAQKPDWESPEYNEWKDYQGCYVRMKAGGPNDSPGVLEVWKP